MILYMPTLALVNAIALKQVDNPEKEFGQIRMWGTIGWIVSGLVIGWMAWEPATELIQNASAVNASAESLTALKLAASKLSITYKVAAVIAAGFGLFSFFLPNTPPPKAGQQVSVTEILGLDALKILKNKNYLIFFIASILICIPLAFYYGQANLFLNEVGMSGAAAKMTLGQVAETLFLFLMPFFFLRFGTKKMILIGMFAWILRYALFAYGNMDSNLWMLYAGIILHGICYDFFFVTGQIYTDNVAGPKVRSSAQGLITLATYGIGMYIGFYTAGLYVDKYKLSETTHNWHQIWIFPCLFAAGVTLMFIAFFNEKKVKQVA
jgi:nucleoside transporter